MQRSRVLVLAPVRLRETLDLQSVGKLEEVVEIRFLDLDLSFVHEEQQIANDLLAGILEHDDRMFFRQSLEESIEVVTASS